MHAVAHAIMFHHFWNDDHPRGQGAISADELDAMIGFIGRQRLLGASEWKARAEAGTLEGWEVCLTLDDGLKCQYDIAAPVLESHDLTAFWFVYTGPMSGVPDNLEVYRAYRTRCHDDIDSFYDAFYEKAFELGEELAIRDAEPRYDAATYLAEYPFYSDADRWFRYVRDEVLGPNRYHAVMDAMIVETGERATDVVSRLWMAPDDLRRLERAGHVIGLHSHTHPTRLERLLGHEQRREYQDNYDALARILDAPPTSMSHPCNSYSSETASILEELGVTLGFRSNMSTTSSPSHLEWPREDHANVMTRMPA